MMKLLSGIGVHAYSQSQTALKVGNEVEGNAMSKGKWKKDPVTGLHPNDLDEIPGMNEKRVLESLQGWQEYIPCFLDFLRDRRFQTTLPAQHRERSGQPLQSIELSDCSR
jgi:hypothetical protein